jgi:Na+/H+ antiporter NhaD/arsenite permease-like protein
MSGIQIIAICLLVLVFAIGSVRHVHVGALALAAAVGVGLTFGAESVSEVMRGWPVDLMLILMGMTYLLAIARGNGTLDRLVDSAVRRAGSKKFLLPWLMFGIALAIASMGNPLAAMVVIPIAMVLAEQNGRDPVVMGLGAINGSVAGCFAPTSLYGILTVSIGKDGGVDLDPFAQFAVVLAIVVVLQFAAQFIFRQHAPTSEFTEPDGVSGSAPADTPDGGPGLPGSDAGVALATRPATRDKESEVVRTTATPVQRVTILALILLVVFVVGMPIFGFGINIGAISLALAVMISLLFPKESRAAIDEIDWSTILLVGGIVTYVGLLQRMGALERLGELASTIPWPLVAVFTLCFVGALISAFASTTALLPVIIPLSLPLVAQGDISGVGLIIALALSATLVDSTPFSTSGAIAVASSSEAQRPRVTTMLLRWGLSMAVVGPLVTCGLLVLPSYL